ncbi:MAG: J domain-containing protein [Lachnospiraceae bacterium]|nr:J domain-containing protein [Lachnospiraceae bacterium]
MVDYYAVLEVMSSASDEVIKSAYKALGKKYHPDSQKYSPEFCQKKMTEINEAYDVLSNSVKRKQYDYEYQHYRAKYYSESAKSASTKEQVKTATSYNDKTFDGDESQGLLKSIFKGMESMLQKNKQIIDNAYIEGIGMDDFELVRAYMQNYGFKRKGFSMVMEERELLARNDEGKLVPTEKFRLYWR